MMFRKSTAVAKHPTRVGCGESANRIGRVIDLGYVSTISNRRSNHTNAMASEQLLEAYVAHDGSDQRPMIQFPLGV